MSALFGDLAAAIAQITELKRAVLILNARLEDNTRSVDYNSRLLEKLLARLPIEGLTAAPPVVIVNPGVEHK